MTAPGAEALRFVAWSRLLTPLVPEMWREQAWALLELPGDWDEVAPDFWSTFHVGLPGPRVSLLLHAALDSDGGRAREDWMRVASHLGLVWGEHTLPPDHLGVALELFACALDAREEVLVRELRARYLAPWCERARARLAGAPAPFRAVPERLAADLKRAVASAEAATSAP